MNNTLFCFFDHCSNEWFSPFLAASTGVALRQIKDSFKGTRHPVALHADDIDLYSIGSFDTRSGVLASSNPEFVAHINEVLS